MCALLEVRSSFAQHLVSSSIDSVFSDTLADGIKIFRLQNRSISSQLPSIPKSRLYIISESRHKTMVTWDSLETFKIQNTLEGLPIQLPTYVNFDLYKVLKKEQQKLNIRAKLIQEGTNQQQDRKGLLDFSINVPGGENSAFST